VEDFMATRITVVRNPNGQFKGFMCKHSGYAGLKAECEGHTVLCERCASAVKNGAELFEDDSRELITPTQVAVTAVQKKRAAAAAGR
jgi:uncharacterized Fe-S cluster protein YjdI